VHLATVLGYPVAHDYLYGSTSRHEGAGQDDEDDEDGGEGAHALASSAFPAPPKPPPGVCAALCVHCAHGARAAFSQEQLRTHGICLHALRLDVHRGASRVAARTAAAAAAAGGTLVPSAAPPSAFLLPLLTEACGAFPPPASWALASNDQRHGQEQRLAGMVGAEVTVKICVPPPSWAV
jgi:hypothetical protein